LETFRYDIKNQTNAASDLAAGLTEMRTKYNLASKTFDLLNSLQYLSIYDRHSQIAEAHHLPFEWIFSPDGMDNLEVARPTFDKWLQSDEKLYWIIGKPGSGKSTLVKWLCAHDKTKALLQAWAGPHQLVIASHFFWGAGTDLQKSQTGFLQSLLFDALRRCTGIIPDVVGDRWVTGEEGHPSTDRPWAYKELSASFSRLSS
jgi:hypothetical protein